MKLSSPSSKVVRFGVYEVDLRSGELWKHGIRLRLQEQPRQILSILLEQPGEIVSRNELCKRLWPNNTFVDFDHSLNTAVMRLREVLSDSSDQPRYIETLPRRGYRFIVPVEEVTVSGLPRPVIPPSPPTPAQTEPLPAPAPILDTPAGQKPEPLRDRWRQSPRKLVIAALFAAALALLVAAVVFLSRTSGRGANSGGIKSIVVLPLENLSGDKDQEYFADGMTDELIAHLAKIRSLRVISRTSAMEYKGSRKSLSDIARDLKVDAVVEGTVLRSGNRVRITAELVQVATDRHLWAETYESELTDVLALQSQVASSIVNEIRIKLTPEEQQSLASARSITTESYENYLRGRYYWNKRSEEGLTRAIEYFKLAAEEDPRDALAYAGLADCYSIIGSAIVGTVPSQDVAPKAKAAALKAIELDPTLAQAETSLATVRFNYDWDWPAASDGFQRAIELNPSYATAYQRYSLYLMAMGRTEESIDQINRARDLDPVSVSMNFSLGWRLYMARRYDAAIEQLRNTIDMDPTFALPHLVLGQALIQKGFYDQAIAELQTASTISHDSAPMISSLGYAFAVARKRPEAQQALAKLLAQENTQYVSPFYLAIVYTGLGEVENALNSLDKAYADRSNGIVFLKVDPQLDSLRTNSRFLELQRRLAFPK